MKNLLKNLFGKKKSNPISVQVGMSGYSQPYVLHMRMFESQIKHGEIVDADLVGVRLENINEKGETCIVGKPAIFFCPLQDVVVNSVLSPGDEQRLPTDVKLHNFTMPEDFTPGIYLMRNVLLHANGNINVITTKETTLELLYK